MSDSDTQLVKCPFCGAPKHNYVGPWETETKCDYCGSVFFIHREEKEKDDDDISLKAAAFKDAIDGTGGEELYPAPDEAERNDNYYALSRALGAMVSGVLFSILFTLLAVNAYVAQDMGAFTVFVLLIALFVFVSFVGFHFLPKDQQTHELPDYGGD
jgi:uncharacterized protein YrzB (UPF0473 family)